MHLMGIARHTCSLSYHKPDVCLDLWLVKAVDPPALGDEDLPLSPRNIAPLVASSAGVSKLIALYWVFLACIWRGASYEMQPMQIQNSIFFKSKQT